MGSNSTPTGTPVQKSYFYCIVVPVACEPTLMLPFFLPKTRTVHFLSAILQNPLFRLKSGNFLVYKRSPDLLASVIIPSMWALAWIKSNQRGQSRWTSLQPSARLLVKAAFRAHTAAEHWYGQPLTMVPFHGNQN